MEVNLNDFDFGGYATRNDLVCSDGVVIKKNAFEHQDGETVPLMYAHDHKGVNAILGNATLQNRPDGVYAYCKFNNTKQGLDAKEAVMHGDISSLSICAGRLSKFRNNIVKGNIKELSLVLSGANPGAFIDTVIQHSDETGEDDITELTACWDENLTIYHADCNTNNQNKEGGSEMKTLKDIVDTMTEEQKNAMYALIDIATSEGEDEGEDDDEGDEDMKHNLFENEYSGSDNDFVEISHADQEMIIGDMKKYGTLKESFIEHAQDYGIENIEYLFPDAKAISNTPDFIKRKTEWVDKLMSRVHHSPFSRIKSVHADITEDEARAKGYIKGKLKKEEVFTLLKRATNPTTIYKKQKIDRDDVLDITDFDVIAYIKAEMRLMLDEEIARAILVGDGRLTSDDDHIKEDNIRPIWKDSELYTIKKVVEVTADSTADSKVRDFIRAAVKARKDYRGSGNPILYTTEDVLTDALLMEDKMGRIIYDSVEKLKTALRVSDIVTAPIMENCTRTDGGKSYELMGIIVNPTDYTVGADKGGAINMFDDFDIDYNRQKYLIETRCSGALTKPYSAISIEATTTISG